MASYPEFDSRMQELGLRLQRPRPALAGTLRPESGVSWQAVRALERLAAAGLLVGLLPLLTVFAAIVVVLSRRTPFIAHCRVGQDGVPLWAFKLRTMWGAAGWNHKGRGVLVERLESEPVAEAKTSADPRITSGFAALCRKFSIDELPQLWNVVRGEMSLVGPRPLTADELAEHYGDSAADVLRLKPGLTGLWQIRGRSRLNYRRRRKYDLFLVRKWSVRMYAGILLMTVPRVLTGRDAW